MARIVVLSDIHLSPTHGFFWQNWCVARDFADAAKADAAVINGDLAINGPDSDAEIAFAAAALKSLRTRGVALPGNHDVGDEPPGQDPDRWTLNAGRWLLVGVNAQLFGSGLPREHAQDQWLDERLSAAAGRPVALFLHKPLFLQDPADDFVTTACLVPSARTRLLKRLHRPEVRLVVSGHLHQHRHRTIGGLRHLWVPAVAFAAPQELGGDGRCGIAVLDFSRDGCPDYNRTAPWVGLARPSGDQGSWPL
jgi:3',5'-cyclic AMP phosphodiesterase CpdA